MRGAWIAPASPRIGVRTFSQKAVSSGVWVAKPTANAKVPKVSQSNSTNLSRYLRIGSLGGRDA